MIFIRIHRDLRFCLILIFDYMYFIGQLFVLPFVDLNIISTKV